MQVAGDAHALLRRGEPPLAFGLALGVPGALLELGDPLPTEPRPVSGEPGGRPYPGAEEDLRRKAVSHEVRPEKSQGAGRDKDPAQAVVGFVPHFCHGVKGDGEADWRPEPVAESVQGRRRGGDDGEHRERRKPPQD